jgi:hypothetical protein
MAAAAIEETRNNTTPTNTATKLLLFDTFIVPPFE